MRSLSVGDTGPSYLASFLDGETGLCSKLYMCPIGEGQYTTYVPSTKKHYDISRIHLAGILSAKDSSEVLSSFPVYLKDSDTKLRTGTMIVQSPWSQPSDAVPRSLDDQLLLEAGFGVCHTCKVQNLDSIEFYFMIGDTIAMRYVACIIDSNMTIIEACSSSGIRFCESVISILVPAFDGETILMWERDLNK